MIYLLYYYDSKYEIDNRDDRYNLKYKYHKYKNKNYYYLCKIIHFFFLECVPLILS
jgi:hypothetical protein